MISLIDASDNCLSKAANEHNTSSERLQRADYLSLQVTRQDRLALLRVPENGFVYNTMSELQLPLLLRDSLLLSTI